MAIFKALTFDGVNSLDYGIYITGEAVYNAPERAVEMVNIPGKNGALTLDQGRFENIEVTYHAGCFADNQADFADKVMKFRNALASRYTYKRLTDEYHPDEYRLGLYKSGLDVDAVRYGTAGEFNITFDCKPQRFLVDGDREISPTDWSDVQTESGELVTIDSDGSLAVKSLEVSLSPIQDLNGYDKPWVGGAGKNKLTLPDGTFSSGVGVTATVKDGVITFSGTATDNGWISYRTGFSLEGGTYTLKDFANKTASGAVGTRIQIISTSGGNFTLPWASALDGHNTATATTASNFEVRTRITSGVDYNGVVIKPMLVSGSTAPTMFEPYENVCPISGRTAVGVSRIGANCLNLSDRVITSAGVTATVKDGVITFSGTATADGWIGYGSASLRGGTYTLTTLANKTVSGAVGTRFQIYSTSGGNLSVVWASSTDASVTATVSTADDYTLRTRITNGMNYDGVAIKPMLVIGSTAPTAFEPYNGQTYTTVLGRTVYGGTLDVVSGVLTVDREMRSYYGSSDEGWMSDGATRFAIGINNSYSDGYTRIKVLSNEGLFASSGGGVGTIFLSNKQLYYYPPSSVTSLSEYKTWLASNPLQVVYPLATPQTYQLTPQQIDLLLGTNHLWSDGEITVEYGVHPYYNPTPFESKPLIKVTGTGTLGIGEYILTITGTASQTLYIDCETMEIYALEGTVPTGASSLVSINRNDFPVLEPGTNYISVGSGITAVTITPRWWRI